MVDPNSTRPDPLPLVTLESVSLTVGNRSCLSDIDWTINPEELWLVRGGPGSGKSLLLEVLLGRQTPTRGRRRYPAFVAEYPDAAIGIPPKGAVRLVSTGRQQEVAREHSSFQQARWHAAWTEPVTVREFLSPRRVLGWLPFEVRSKEQRPKDWDARRSALLEELALENLFDRRVAQLSNGELRKLLLLAARLAAPRLLLLDDPLAGLDEASRTRVIRALRRWAADGVELVIATERDSELAELATHRMILGAGSRSSLSTPTRVGMASALESIASMPKQAAAEAPRTAPLIRCENVRVQMDGTTLLAGIDWQVNPGEHWMITGPNGSGKTTLLSLLTGDHPQSYSNRIWVFGKRLGVDTTLWERRRKVGHVAPELYLHYPPGWSALETVLSGIHSTVGVYHEIGPADRARAQAWLATLGITSAERPLAALCEAERRLVMVARALLAEPSILLLDEPTQGLDPQQSARIHELLDACAKQRQVSIVLATHHRDERPACITRWLALDGGVVSYSGPLHDS